MFQPERLTLARQRRGMNKTSLAKAISVTAATISAYEKGSSEPTPNTIGKLSDTLQFPIPFFFADLDHEVPVGSASFRALSRMTASQRDAALASGTLCVVLNDWIEKRFDLPEPDVPDLNPGILDPAGAATLVRTRWGLGESPIANVVHLLEAHGVRLFSLTDECREVDAFSFWRGDTPFMCLNTRKTAERSIFDAAHELGHLVLHRDHAAPRGRLEERQADSFAANFLMPEPDVRSADLRNPDLIQLAKAKARWRVSAAALNYRLHELGIISDWHYRELCIEMSRLGRNVELNPLPPEQSQILAKVLGFARQEGLGRAAIAKDLHLHVADLNALLLGLTVTALDGGREGGEGDEDSPRLTLVS